MGDPYQLYLGDKDESPLNPSYLEQHYKLKTSCFQLNDKEKASKITEESLKCVKGIRSKLYNSLKFKIENNFAILDRDKFKEYSNEVLKANSDIHFLYFKNEEALKTNLWIKKNILNNGEDICSGDLVMFNNNISVENENDPNARPIKINNGQFAIVISVSDTFIPDELKNIKDKLYFRYIDLILQGGNNPFTVLSLENYRCNPKAELSKNEKKSIHILFNRLVDNYLNNESAKDFVKDVRFRKDISELKSRLEKGEKVKTKLRKRWKSILQGIPSTEFYKFKNYAELKFGWAMTVHKSMSYKWDEIIFNVDKGENQGINKESYFRWLYTGISRAKKKVNLINYKSITPYNNTQLNDNNNGKSAQTFIISENPDQNLRLEELKNFISFKITDSDYTITNIQHLDWQERYTFQKRDQNIVLKFGYNKKGIFALPVVIGATTNISNELIDLLCVKKEIKSLDIIKDEWRKNEYTNLKVYLNKHGIKFEFIQQLAFRDRITLYNNSYELKIEVIYDGDGLFSSISAVYYSDISIWNDFKTAIQDIIN